MKLFSVVKIGVETIVDYWEAERVDQPERILKRGGEGAISTKLGLIDCVAKFETCSNVSWLGPFRYA